MKKIEINIASLKSNINVLKNQLNEGVKFCAVVKANAYGHGIKICKFIKNQVDYFAVATFRETVNLRKIVGNSNILVLQTVTKSEAKASVKLNIELTVASVFDLKNLWTNSKIHIKVNTGMNRLGITKLKELEQICAFAKANSIEIVGLYSHFYQTNDIKQMEKQQLKFEQFRIKLIKLIGNTFISHLSSTNAFINSSRFRYDMVRSGIGMYGYCDNLEIQKKLLPVMRIFANVIGEQFLKSTDKVGYSHLYEAKNSETIYVLNVGYYDGFLRKLKNKKLTKNVKVVGNVCMDLVMIKSKKKLKIGSEICVLNNAKQLAKNCGTIEYEILTNIKSNRFKVLIKNEGKN